MSTESSASAANPIVWRQIPPLVDRFIKAHTAMGSGPLAQNIITRDANSFARISFTDSDGMIQSTEMTGDHLMEVIHHPFASGADIKTAIDALNALAVAHPQLLEDSELAAALEYYNDPLEADSAPAIPNPPEI